MENRKRNVHLHVMVTPDELAAIHERMAEAGISNAGAYVRKMALNGYIPVSYTHLVHGVGYRPEIQLHLEAAGLPAGGWFSFQPSAGP